jgi:hypothetical protein
MTRVSKSATFKNAGEQTLQDPYIKYNYEGYSAIKDIPGKAQGKLGARFFDDDSMQQANIPAIKNIKKKMLHNDLEKLGYLIHDKPKPDTEEHLDEPIYEIFDLPNPNYRRQFVP